MEGRLKPNGLPDIVLQIDRLEIGYKTQNIGITPPKTRTHDMKHALIVAAAAARP